MAKRVKNTYIMKKPELADALAERTGFYKGNMREVVDALADIVIDQLLTATYDEPAEIHISPGVIIGGKRYPERMVVNPSTQEAVMTAEKVIPYSKFKVSARRKLTTTEHEYKK